MAIVHVQTNGVANLASPVVLAFTSNVTLGNRLFCDVAFEGSGSVVNSITDTLGNTWTSVKFASAALNSRGVASWSTLSVASGACTVTATLTGAIRVAMALSEYSGLGAITLDQQNDTDPVSTSTSHSCGSITTTQVGLIRAVLRIGGAYTVSSPPAGYAARYNTGALRSITTYDKIASGTETTNPTLVTVEALTHRCMVYNVYTAAAGLNDARASQLVVETLSHPTPDARVGQLVVETLTSLVVVVLPDARVSQFMAETLTSTPVLVGPVRVSQAPIEILDQYPTTARVSQTPLETVHQWTAPLTAGRVSQAPLEIIYPYGCYVYVEPEPPPCPAALPLAEEDE